MTGASAARAMTTGTEAVSYRLFRRCLLRAILTQRDSAKVADQAEEGTAVGAGIPLGGALLPAASATGHRVVFVELGHGALGGEVVAFDLVDQRRSGDAKLDSGAGPVACMVLEGALDVLALEVFETERRVPPVSYSWPSPELSWQMLHAHCGLPPPQDE